MAWLGPRLARGRREIFSEVVDLTPELAELLLANNPENRQLKVQKLDVFKRDIEDGRWKLNGEAVIVARTGELNDGQHRCRAVVESGRPIKVLMTFGPERETRTTIDTGTARTPGDLLQMSGYRDGNNVAAIAAFIWQVEKFGSVPLGATNGASRPTKAEVQEVVERHQKRIYESFGAFPHTGLGKIASLSQLVFCHAYLCLATGLDAEITAFMTALVTGEKQSDKDPIFVARERLLAEKHRRPYPARNMETVFRAWNMHRKRQTTTRIQVMDSWPKIVK